MSDAVPLLRAERLCRIVDGRAIVNDVTFAVSNGEVLAIVGPSGSGKSSLLRLLNRLDEPTSGTVYIGGSDYRLIAPRDLRRRICMVMQNAYLFPGTIAENVRFGPRQHNREMSDDAVDQLLGRVGLPGMAGRSVANLSGGEAQRVSLARALANDPDALLLDEPTSALDEESKRGIEVLVEGIVKETGLTCIVVTHDAAQAGRIARTVAVTVSGRLVRIGPASEVLDAQADLP